MLSRNSRIFATGLAMAACIATSVPASAQSDGSDARMRKLESEVRALQRKVFPGGDGRYFEPEVSGADTARAAATRPSTTAVTDILARLDAMETQLAGLTAQTEENTNTIRQLRSRMAVLDGGAGPGTGPGTGPKTGGATGGATGATTTTPAASAPAATAPGRALSTTPTPTSSPSTTTPSTTTLSESTSSGPTSSESTSSELTSSGPTAERLAAVTQIAKPQTDDAGDDEYSYGYRLWDAGYFPEAQQQLSMFVEKYPDHWRTTYGRNLLGRAYLDDGKPSDAAPWFLRNYQANKTARRAPDSLLYLAISMIALKDTRRACIALAEFSETYPAVASGRLADTYQANLRKVDCD